jgi:hypothetical protein
VKERGKWTAIVTGLIALAVFLEIGILLHDDLRFRWMTRSATRIQLYDPLVGYHTFEGAEYSHVAPVALLAPDEKGLIDQFCRRSLDLEDLLLLGEMGDAARPAIAKLEALIAGKDAPSELRSAALSALRKIRAAAP